MTPLGFDLTQFGSRPVAPTPGVPVQQPQPQQPAPQPVAQPQDPNAPQTLDEALTKPIDVNAVNEDGTEYQDKLAKNAPGLKKQLWGIDKFAAPVRPVQVKDKDGKMIWVDGNGNNIVDPNTGKTLTKAFSSSLDDK